MKMSETTKTRKRNSFIAKLLRPKVAIPVTLLILLLLSPFLIRGWYLGQVPDFPEPFDATPLLEYSVPDHENAFTDYRSAAVLYIPPSLAVSELRNEITERGWHEVPDDVVQFLKDNEPALLAWKQGTEKEHSLSMPAKDYDLVINLDVIQSLRDFYRTVMLLCRKLESEGKPQQAWEWYRATIRASRHMGQHGGLIERFAGHAWFHDMGSQLTDWAAHPDLTGEDLRLAIEQLQADWKLTGKTSTVFQLEYLSSMKDLEFGVQGGWEYLDIETQEPILYLQGEPKVSRRLVRYAFFRVLQECDLPYEQRGKVDPESVEFGGIEWSDSEFNQVLDRSPIAAAILGPTFQYQTIVDREEARYRTLLTMLAAQAYLRDHGEFPDDVAQLVPDYLAQLPPDPYSPANEPIIYRRSNDGAAVYSRFENGIDDGGNEISFEESDGTEPLDDGVRIDHPPGRPLTAPKPSRD